jgi:hypothetical protein
MSSIADKRNFCLMLSLPTGQQLAKVVGMVPPSPDVEQMENEQISEQWEILETFGIYDEVSEAVDWFTEVLESATEGDEDKPTKQMVDGSKVVLLSYGMALVQKLLENNRIALIAHEDWLFDE